MKNNDEQMQNAFMVFSWLNHLTNQFQQYSYKKRLSLKFNSEW